MKEFVREFKKQFTCLGGNTKKYITFTVALEKEVTRINKNGEKITKKAYNYILQITSYNSLIAQDLWQAHYQILSIIFERVHRIKCKYEQHDKKVKLAKLNTATAFLNSKTLKMI